MPAPAHPACVSRLRIQGFKTFADPVSLDVLPGLTGLVGPNGCGKDNVVDALRWAMGEGNARTLRGAEMEDVIFAGTAAQPGLHQAEVAMVLDGGSFPTPFAALATEQVTRRIERGTCRRCSPTWPAAPARSLWWAKAGWVRSSRPARRSGAGCSTRLRAPPACAPTGRRRMASCTPPRQSPGKRQNRSARPLVKLFLPA